MAQTDSKKLDGGDLFPSISLKITDGSTVNLPEDLNHDYTVLLGYRGKW